MMADGTGREQPESARAPPNHLKATGSVLCSSPCPSRRCAAAALGGGGMRRQLTARRIRRASYIVEQQRTVRIPVGYVPSALVLVERATASGEARLLSVR